MGKNYKNIDDLFQQELGQTSHKAPAHVKVNIDKAIGFQKRRFLYLWILASLTVAALAWIFFQPSVQSESISKKSNQTTLLTQHNWAAETTSEVFANSSSEESSNNNHDKDASKTASNQPITQVDPAVNNPATSSKKSNHPNPNNATKTNPTKLTNTNPSLISTSSVDSITDIQPNKTKDDQLNNLSTPPKNNDVILSADSLSDDLANTNRMGLDSTQSDEITLTTNNSLADSTNTADAIAATDSVARIQPDSSSTPDVSITPPEDEYSPWLVTAASGIDAKWSQMPTFVSNDSTNYDHIINDKIGHQGYINISYRLKNSVTFGSGIGYSTLLENYTYYQSQTQYDTTYSWNITLDSIPDSTGWIYFQDSTLVENVSSSETELYNANGRNKRTYLHIPIQIGTSFLFEKVRWDLYAQGRFNLLLKSAITYVENNQVVVLPKGGFKQSYFDLVLGTSVHYNLIGNLYVSGSVRYRPPLSKEYYPTITNRLQNLQVGVGFSLGF